MRMTLKGRRIRRDLQGALAISIAILSTAARAPSAAVPSPPQGAGRTLVIMPISRLVSEACIYDQISVDVDVLDGATLAPVGGAQVTFDFGGGGSTQVTGPGGVAGTIYSSDIPGQVPVTITASKDGYAGSTINSTLDIKDCVWQVNMFYFGTYLGKDGVWKLVEDAILPDTPLTRQGSTLVGSRTVRFSYLAWVQNPGAGVTCTKLKSEASAQASVKGEVQGRSLVLTITAEKATFQLPNEFECSYGDQLLAGFGLPALSHTFTLKPPPLVVPVSGGTRTLRLTHSAYLINTSGSGAMLFTVKRSPPK